MSIIPRTLARSRAITATGALLAVALLLACAVAWQAQRAAAAHREATRRLLDDHAAYAAAEFARRAAATLEAGSVTLQHFPTSALEDQPASTPLPSAAAYRETIGEQDYWCACFDAVDRYVVLDLNGGALDATGPALDSATAAWLRREMTAHAAYLVRNPREAEVNLYDEIEGRKTRNSYQLRIKRGTVRVLGSGPGARALLFTVVFDDQDRPRAAYGMLAPPAAFASVVFQRVFERNALLPSFVSRGASNDSLMRVVVEGPGGAELFRSAAGASAAARAREPLPGDFGWMAARVELRPQAAARLVEGGVPASPLPLLLALLAVTAAVVTVAFLQLRRQHELARLRADFVSGVSHELRTPLTQIRMFSELLLGGRLRSDAERDRSLRLIDREARRLAFLVENVLDFSRAERGTLAISPEPARVADAMEEIVEGFAPVARARGMRIRTHLDPDAAARLDRGGFRQVLLNFLENAVKYGPAGQTIAAGASRGGDRVRVWVDDEGPGIPAGQRERIWEPYYRLNREIDRVVGGSGIGLSVVRDLVARHGGRAWMEDAPGGGARFVAEFPAARMPADAEETRAAEMAEAGR
ncbi:MAG TPA: HAMP domain-containing sensor histidine kinase [Longimicrobium sp.]|nr:HAMP domain-containing sensor histidine kinase [Longimicrobium sp.]